MNLYAYANQNPINLTDPSGLDVYMNKDCNESCCDCTDWKWKSRDMPTGSPLHYEREVYDDVIALNKAKELAAELSFWKSLGDQDPTISYPLRHKVQTALMMAYQEWGKYDCWISICKTTGDIFLMGCKRKKGYDTWWMRAESGDKPLYNYFYY